MTLLFTTRKVDKNDERTGFVSGWLLEFSQHLTKLIVICQEVGDISDLPKNIEVYSLGKEKGYNKIRQFFLLLYYFITLLPKIDGIFSHMVPHFAIIAGPWCKIYHKKLIQWYVHKTVSPWLKIANLFIDEYITTNPESFHLKTKKTIHYFGHGINTNIFKPSSFCHSRGSEDPVNYKIPAEIYPLPQYEAGVTTEDHLTILTVGRISPSKNIDLMIQAVEKILKVYPELKNKILFQIVGAPGLEKQKAYYNLLSNYVVEKNLSNNINFLGPMSPDKTLPYYQNCNLFINLSDTGSVDKAVLEAMAVEKIVLTSNDAFKNIIPEKLFLTNKDPNHIANKILEIYNLSETEKESLQKNLRQEVVANHNLTNLVNKILSLYN